MDARCQAGKANNSFYSFLSHWKAEGLYKHRAYKIAPRSLKLNDKLRFSAYYDVKACKGHLVQFWN